MNGKKARKLRRLAVEMAYALAKDTSRTVLEANPVKLYKELKNIDRAINQKQ